MKCCCPRKWNAAAQPEEHHHRPKSAAPGRKAATSGPRGLPRGLGVAFGPPLDGSRVCPKATPGHWGVAARLPLVHGAVARPSRDLGVAFGPTLDPSRASLMATPGLRGHPRGLGLARTWGWPSGQPFYRASLIVGLGLAVTASSDPDSGGFWPGRCGPARALVAFSDQGGVGSV